MSGDPKRTMLDAREQVVQEVQKSVEHVSRIIEQFHSFRVKEDETELAKLRQELDDTMQAARRAEERVAALGKSAEYDISEFE
jgi:histidyl-tRNA synthetase